MRWLELLTRDPLLKVTALVLAFLLWALVQTERGVTGGVKPVGGAVLRDSAQSRGEPPQETRSVPVSVRLTGQPLAGWELAGPPEAEPANLTVTGPATALQGIDSLRLPAIRLDGRTASETLDIVIDTAGLGLKVVPLRVRVTISIRQISTEAGEGGAVERPGPGSAPAGALL